MNKQRVQKIGHRGAAGYVPENTLAAIQKGIALGADYVELDIQRTRDGRLVLMHDKFVDRTTDGAGRVSDLSIDEIRGLKAAGGQPVPLLEEALAIANGRVGVILESITPGIGPQVYQSVKSLTFDGPIIFSSFIHADILAIRERDSSVHTMALLEGIPVTMTAFAREAKASHVGVSVDSITGEFVSAFHDSNLQVFVYTVNDPKLIALAKDLGVDGIISDYPDRI